MKIFWSSTLLSRQDVIKALVDPKSALQFNLKQWNDLVIILRHEKLLARFYLLLEDCGSTVRLPPQVKRHCENAKTLAAKQKAVVLSESKQLKRTFQCEDYRLLFLKGAAYTLSNTSASLGRVFSDIDILVPKQTIAVAERKLAIHGWLSKEVDDYDDRYYRQWSHEIPPMQHGTRGTVLDLHHNLVPPVSGKAIDMNKFLAIAGREIDGINVLNEPGLFFHSAVHLFFNDDYSAAFRDMTDLYLLVKDQPESFFVSLFELHEVAGFRKESYIALKLLKIEYDVTLPIWVEEHIENSAVRISQREFALLKIAAGPKHSLLEQGECELHKTLAELRGLFLKMPFHILIFHSCMKLYRTMVKLLLGEHIFTKSSSSN